MSLEPERIERLLKLAGTMADAALNVTGGQGLNFWVQPASVCSLTAACDALRKATKEYNDAILSQ